MLRYRAAAFFGRLYCPEIINGMMTDDEASDIRPLDESDVTDVFADEPSPEEIEKAAKYYEGIENEAEQQQLLQPEGE